MTPEEEVRLKDGLDAFFKGAGRGGWNREVNEEVANVFATMLCFVNDCSKAMNWVPRPTYNPGATWLLTNLTRSSINSLGSGQYKICQVDAIRKYQTALTLASSGVHTSMPPCK
jgi:hypothetical protein